MNAALLMMTSTIMAGADAAPAAPAAPAPVVVSGTGCGAGGCGPVVGSGCCDAAPACGGSRVGFFDKLKSRMGGMKCKHKHDDCGCAAPAPCHSCAPAPAPAPAPCHTCAAPAPCDTCGHAARPNLFDRIKAKFGHKHKGCNDCAPACDSCGTPGCATPGPAVIPPATGGTTMPPKDMPKPMDPVKPKPKTSGTDAPPAISIPTPGASLVPPPAVTPVSGPKLSGSTSPY